jgi:hypothetical protein
VYHGSRAIWASNTNGCATDLIFGSHGNVVTYPGNCRAYATNANSPAASFYTAMQNEGNFVEYRSSVGAVWATNTVGK